MATQSYGRVRQVSDGLVNVVANLGTERDKASHSQYFSSIFSPQQLVSAYENSWLAGAIIDYPAEDATRKGRAWRAEPEQIIKIEALERKWGLLGKLQGLLVASRLYGGAALYINTADADQALPLTAPTEIRSLVLLTREQLSAGQVVTDIDSEYYGVPEFYTLSSNTSQVKIHRSRLIIMVGQVVPGATQVNQGWGNSILQSTYAALQQVDGTMANMASLVFEAKVDVFKFKGLAQIFENQQDGLVNSRLSAQAAMKGINGAVVIDSEDDYEQKSASFAGLPEVVSKFMDAVAGASRIPVTRLYGRAAVGLSGSGDGDERVYFDRIGHLQSTIISPAMSLLDECLINQALGERPPEVFYEWRPLRQLTENERADILVKVAAAARNLAGPNASEILPLDALSDSIANELNESGLLPGLDQAIKKYGSLSEQGLGVDEFVDSAPRRVSDAEPMPLYVSRKVLNAAAILKHYQDQGVSALTEVDDMHVTITYSRSPVDWMKMGDAWNSELKVNAGGARIMEAFGESKDTLVLAFNSSELAWRHESMVQDGASWDWPDYQPHVSISYAFDGVVNAVEPWRGEILLGPEIFEKIDEDWSSGVKE